MTERIVNDPSQHGWVEKDGKWVWAGSSDGSGGGGSGGGYWSLNYPDIYYDEGKVGVGTSDPASLFHLHSSYSPTIRMTREGGNKSGSISLGQNELNFSVNLVEGTERIGFSMGSLSALTIQSDLTSKFADAVSIGPYSDLILKTANPEGMETPNTEARLYHTNTCGIAFKVSGIVPLYSSGEESPNRVNLGTSDSSFKNGYFTGALYADSVTVDTVKSANYLNDTGTPIMRTMTEDEFEKITPDEDTVYFLI